MLEVLCWQKVSFYNPLTEKCLINDISVTFYTSERIGIIGASGAGKSTFLKLSNHLLSATQGHILYQQQSLNQYKSQWLRREIALVLQEPKLLRMSVKEALIYPLHLQELPSKIIESRLNSILDLFAIPDSWLDKKEGELSLGQRQIIAIARAMVMQPQVLLLDEPTSALDQGKATKLREILINLSQNQEILIIVANHQLDWIREFATRIIILEEGKLIKDMPFDEVNWQEIKDNLVKQNNESDFADF